MKKLLVMTMVLGLMFTCVGCGDSVSDDVTEAATTEAAVEELDASDDMSVEESEPVASLEDCVELNGQTVQLGMDITDEFIETLGYPNETMEAPSCHYDGNDTIYVYDDFILYTYQDGEENALYLIELSTENVQTSYLACVGMTMDEVISCHGEAFENAGVMMEYTYENAMIDFTLDESGVVTMIEIY